MTEDLEPLSILKIRQALIDARGNVSAVARDLKRSRSVIKQHIDKSVELTALVAELRETIIDTAEDNIFLAVETGDLEASKFILRTVGKDRGYSTKVENLHDVSNAESILARIRAGKEKALSNSSPPPPSGGE